MTPSLSTFACHSMEQSAAPHHAAYSRRKSALISQSTGTGRRTPESMKIRKMQSRQFFNQHSSSARSVLESGSYGQQSAARGFRKQLESEGGRVRLFEETHPLLGMFMPRTWPSLAAAAAAAGSRPSPAPF
ncbi:hypothetical protein T484DRAFT_1743846 [Baffinella frigidus]|nr:hypothetical protein T484DRAFT_1743846 [Cryptophyta sp. CCMP2293]